jgi:hypothetical protein
MKSRYLLVGTVATALALLVWQSVSNAALPWHEATVRTFANSAAAVAAIRAQAPENGVYYANQGVLLTTAFTPDLANRENMMGTMLGSQFLLDLGVALVLCFAVLRLPASGAVATGVTLALAGLATALVAHFSHSIWYGFPLDYALVNALDLAISAFVAGLVLGAPRNRYSRAPAVRADARGIHVGSGLSASRTGETAAP